MSGMAGSKDPVTGFVGKKNSVMYRCPGYSSQEKEIAAAF